MKIEGCERCGTCTFLISYEYQVYIYIYIYIYISGLASLNSHHETQVWTLNSHFYHLFLLFQHTFIQSAKSLTILNNMIQEALNIMEEESTREDNEV